MDVATDERVASGSRCHTHPGCMTASSGFSTLVAERSTRTPEKRPGSRKFRSTYKSQAYVFAQLPGTVIQRKVLAEPADACTEARFEITVSGVIDAFERDHAHVSIVP